MSRSLQEYVEQWTSPGGYYVEHHPLDADLTPTACIVDEVIWDSIGSGPIWTTDFGNAICWFLYYRSGDVADPAELTPTERAEVDQVRSALEELLARYVRDGYSPSMKQELMDIVNGRLPNFSIDNIYVLPDDLSKLLDALGNPLVEDEEDEDEVRNAPAFDLANPAHRLALRERLELASQ